MENLRGKTVLITGGSRGIGRAFALDLAENGADIAVNYCGHDAEANDVKSQIEAMGRRCTLAKADLVQPDCTEKIFSLVSDVDILVLNASLQYPESWENITREQFDKQVCCNFRSALFLIQRAVPYMKRRKWGRIVTIGSVQEKKPHPRMLVYSATKAALTMMAKSLSLQLAGDGITVNSIAPGVVLTERNKEALSNTAYRQSVLEKIPAGFCAVPRDCVSALRFLCSAESGYVTGQNIFVDGGMGIL